MKITNRFGVPETLVRFLERDTYSRGASRISASQLIDSPRVGLLRARHDSTIEVDVTDQLWLLIGKALHHVIEHGAPQQGVTTEQRLFGKVDGWTISGQMDLQEIGMTPQVQGEKITPTVKIVDWKFTGVWSVMNGKMEWERQLNVYAWLAELNGKTPVELEVCAFLRDWNRHNTDREGYPQAAMARVPIKLWSWKERDEYVKNRVRLHQEAAIGDEMGDEPPPCSDEERWIRESKWIVKKPGVEKVSRVFDTRREAEEWVSTKNYPLVIEERQSEPTRCKDNWCQVARHCSQWMAPQKSGA